MIIVITQPHTVAHEAEIVNQLFDTGLQRLHLRKKQVDESVIRNYIESINPRYFSNIILHSHYNLISEYNLGGMQVSVQNIDDRVGRVGVSFHSFSEIETYTQAYDFGFLSPIFDSISKPGYDANFKENELIAFLKKHSEKNIYALGGINTNNISRIKEMGFKGCVVLGALWNADNPVAYFKQLQAVWGQNN